MRMLWTLPKAAPVLLRHFAAYVDLALDDLASAQEEMAARLLASALLILSIFFVVMMACLAVVARTWDTPNRVAAILWMGGAFALLAVFCALYKSRLIQSQSAPFSSVRREWEQDRVVLDSILSPDSE
jgi:uncharacterized membrane protein YqjE